MITFIPNSISGYDGRTLTKGMVLRNPTYGKDIRVLEVIEYHDGVFAGRRVEYEFVIDRPKSQGPERANGEIIQGAR